MSRLGFRAAPVLIGVLVLLVTTAGAGRILYHEHLTELRAFILAPESCPMPCWYGIRPGETSIFEAIDRLEAHPWVGEVELEERPGLYTVVFWEWNGSQPDFVFDDRARTPPYLWSNQNTVEFISLPTRIPFGEIYLLMGEPGSGAYNILTSDPSPSAPNTHHVAAYFDGSLIVDTSVFCPAPADHFWNAPSGIGYYRSPNVVGVTFEAYQRVNWAYRNLPCRDEYRTWRGRP